MSVRLVLSAIAIAAVAACGEQGSPTSPSFSVKPPPPPKGHHVATCSIPKDVVVSKRIGIRGGKLDLGHGNTFAVLPGALLRDTTIIARIPAGTQERVQFSPEGLRFLAPAVLTLNYSPCVTPTFEVKIAYLRADTVVEVVPSVNDPRSKIVVGFLNHFSSYAVAY